MSERRTLLAHKLFRVEGYTARARGVDVHVVRMCSTDWVNVVPVTADGRVVLVRQHRFGVEAPSLEIPGGVAEPGEDPAAAAARELAEETGYVGGRWTSLGSVWSNPAVFDNRTHMFLAEGVEPKGEVHPDPDEEIEVILRRVDEIPALIESGAIAHSLAVASLQRWWLRRLGWSR